MKTNERTEEDGIQCILIGVFRVNILNKKNTFEQRSANGPWMVHQIRLMRHHHHTHINAGKLLTDLVDTDLCHICANPVDKCAKARRPKPKYFGRHRRQKWLDLQAGLKTPQTLATTLWFVSRPVFESYMSIFLPAPVPQGNRGVVSYLLPCLTERTTTISNNRVQSLGRAPLNRRRRVKNAAVDSRTCGRWWPHTGVFPFCFFFSFARVPVRASHLPTCGTVACRSGYMWKTAQDEIVKCVNGANFPKCFPNQKFNTGVLGNLPTR